MGAKTTEENYHNTMRTLAYDNGMVERLLESGKNTRLEKGNCLRKGKQVRLQEILDKRDRKFKHG